MFFGLYATASEDVSVSILKWSWIRSLILFESFSNQCVIVISIYRYNYDYQIAAFAVHWSQPLASNCCFKWKFLVHHCFWWCCDELISDYSWLTDALVTGERICILFFPFRYVCCNHCPTFPSTVDFIAQCIYCATDRTTEFCRLLIQ